MTRKTAENIVKHRGGGVGSVIANHRDGGGNSVTVTTLIYVLCTVVFTRNELI